MEVTVANDGRRSVTVAEVGITDAVQTSPSWFRPPRETRFPSLMVFPEGGEDDQLILIGPGSAHVYTIPVRNLETVRDRPLFVVAVDVLGRTVSAPLDDSALPPIRERSGRLDTNGH